jgi:hypothetical protein
MVPYGSFMPPKSFAQYRIKQSRMSANQGVKEPNKFQTYNHYISQNKLLNVIF